MTHTVESLKAQLKKTEGELQAARARRGITVKEQTRQTINDEDTSAIRSKLQAQDNEIQRLTELCDGLKELIPDTREAEIQEQRAMQQDLEFAVRTDLRGAVVKMGAAIAAVAAQAPSLAEACNNGLALDDATLRYEIAKVKNGLRIFLLHAVRQFPNCVTPESIVMRLDSQAYTDLFPEPQPPKKTGVK